MLTFAQLVAFLSVLTAFGVSPEVVNNIHDILVPKEASTTAVTLVHVNQTPVIENQPIYFGSSQDNNKIIDSMPNWKINVLVNGEKEAPATIQTTTKDRLGFLVNVYDKANSYQKKAVTVTTNYPDLPSSFTLNDGKQASFFCVAPSYPGFPNNGCANENPVSTGTFDFTFTVEDVSKTVSVTIQ